MNHFFTPLFDPEEGRRCLHCDCREHGSHASRPCGDPAPTLTAYGRALIESKESTT